MAEDPNLGVNWKTATPYAYIGRKHWNLKPGGLSQTNIEKLILISEEHDKFMQVKHTELETFKMKNKCAKQILELTLEKFVWSKAANDNNIGPALLFILAAEVKDFLDRGGKVGRQRLQTLFDSIPMPSSNTSHMRKK